MSNPVAFPSDRLLGYLHFHGEGELNRFHGRFKRDGTLLEEKSNPGWRMYGTAKGIVRIPANTFALLEVLPEEAVDLAPLARLGNNDLHGIWLGNTAVDDEQLKHIRNLTGLQWIDVQNNPHITDMGVSYLKSLPNLRYFGCHWTGVTSISLGHLSEMAHLKYLDVWGCDVSSDAIAEFRERLPDCEVRTE